MKELIFNENKPKRLDVYINEQFPLIRPTSLNKFVRQNKVKVNGAKTIAGQKLVKGDVIEVIKFYNNWACFKYKDIDAYIQSYNLIQLTKIDDINNSNFNKMYTNNFLSSFISNTMYYSPSIIILIAASN